MSKSAVLVVVALALAMLVVRCTTPAASLRFRIIVEVGTPSGTKTGSSVMELVLKRPFLIPMPGAGGGDRGGGFQLFGEAPFVELGDRVLFTKYHAKSYQHQLDSAVLDGLKLFARRRAAPDRNDEAIFRELNQIKWKGEVAPSYYPAFAAFADLQDPKSQTEILPDAVQASLGDGYTINRITVHVVGADARPTTSLAERFPVLANERGLLSLAPR